MSVIKKALDKFVAKNASREDLEEMYQEAMVAMDRHRTGHRHYFDKATELADERDRLRSALEEIVAITGTEHHWRGWAEVRAEAIAALDGKP